MSDRERVAAAGADILAEQQQKLKELFPEAFTEGKIDFEKLRATLGDLVDDRPERYSFSWAGKRDAVRLVQAPSRATLVPSREESVNFDETQHIFIEGDNLEVLKILYKSYFGRVKLIYIDPPYNTGKDFIYRDNYTDPLDTYLRLTGQKDSNGNLLTSNPETSGRFHSAWLSMMYPRLFLARQFLSDDGAIFISIGEQEVHNLRLLINEIFGEENFVATLVWQKSKRGDAKLIAGIHDYVLVAVKDKDKAIASGIWRKPKERAGEVLAYYETLRERFGDNHAAIGQAMKEWYQSLPAKDPRKKLKHYTNSDSRGLYFADNFAGPDDGRESRPRYDIIHPVTGKPCKKPRTGWRWDEERTRKALAMDPPLIHFGEDETTVPCRKTYLKNTSFEPFSSVFYRDGRAATKELQTLVGENPMDFPKNTDVLRNFVQIIPDPGAIVMDFFAGSAGLAQAVLEQNREDGGHRRFLLVQLPEPTKKGQIPTIAAIGKERIRQVIANMQATQNGQLPYPRDEDLGFKVFKLTESNMRLWTGVKDADPAEYLQQMASFTNPLVEGWQVENVIYEVALREGFGLNCVIEQVGQETDNTIYRVTDPDKEQYFFICLDNRINSDPTRALGLTKTDLFICRDVALDDTIAANIALNCRLKTI